MLRKFGVAALLLVGFAFAVSGLTAADDKTPSIKDCMAFQKKDGLPSQVEKAAKADKWDDAQKAAADLAKLGEALGKNTPPKNAEKKDEWEKQTKAFAERTAAVETAAKGKKADDVSKAVAALLDKKTCGGCHMNFKGK
jgi:hypothetical protein